MLMVDNRDQRLYYELAGRRRDRHTNTLFPRRGGSVMGVPLMQSSSAEAVVGRTAAAAMRAAIRSFFMVYG